MSLTFGFYNSNNGDRTYDALDVSRIFDGVIEDGVYAGIGEQFAVTPGGGMSVDVGTGRAWFNHTWTYLDSSIKLALTGSSVSLSRIDLVVIKVDLLNRLNSIEILTGTSASSPSPPSLTPNPDTEDPSLVIRHPLAQILVRPGATSISSGDITSLVGRDSCPYVVGAAQSVSTDSIIADLTAQANTWFEQYTANNNARLIQLLQQALKSQVAVYFCRADIATEAVEGQSYKAPFDYAKNQLACVPYTSSLKLGDILIGRNGYYGTVTEIVSFSATADRYIYTPSGEYLWHNTPGSESRPMLFFVDHDIITDAEESYYRQDTEEALLAKFMPAIFPRVDDYVVGRNGCVAVVSRAPYRGAGENNYRYYYRPITADPFFSIGDGNDWEDRTEDYTESRLSPNGYIASRLTEEGRYEFSAYDNRYLVVVRLSGSVVFSFVCCLANDSAPSELYLYVDGVNIGSFVIDPTASNGKLLLDGLHDPSGPTNAANKRYVDSKFNEAKEYADDAIEAAIDEIEIPPYPDPGPDQDLTVKSLTIDSYQNSSDPQYGAIKMETEDTSYSGTPKVNLTPATEGASAQRVRIGNIADPELSTDVANKKYVDDAMGWVDITSDYQQSGGSIDGFIGSLNTDGRFFVSIADERYYITVEHSPGNMLTRFAYVKVVSDDGFVNLKVFIDGFESGRMYFDYGENKLSISGLQRPYNANDAANKKYVDDSITAVNQKIGDIPSNKTIKQYIDDAIQNALS